MSYANGTQFYNLPQTVGNDKRDWFDTNEAFAAVDAALHAAATGQAADAEAISTINTSLASAESDIAALQTASATQSSEISALQATVASQGTAITDVRQDAEDMISAFNEGAASVSTHAYAIGDYFIYNDVLYKATAAIAIGDTIVPNTNCSATNVTSEIKVINGDIDDVKSDLTYLETNSGKLGKGTHVISGNFIATANTSGTSVTIDTLKEVADDVTNMVVNNVNIWLYKAAGGNSQSITNPQGVLSNSHIFATADTSTFTNHELGYAGITLNITLS